METITVRRWVAAPQEQVWAHLLDLRGRGEDAPAFDLERLIGEDATDHVHAPGTVTAVHRRHAHRVEQVEVRLDEPGVPDHVALTVTSGGERWILRIAVDPLPCGGSDVRLEGERDPIGIRRIDLHRSGARSHRVAHDLGLLLDALADRLDALTIDVEPAATTAAASARLETVT